MRKSVAVLTLLSIGLALPVLADDHTVYEWMVGGGVGTSSPMAPSEFKDTFDPNISFGGFATKRLTNNIGVRAELAYDRHGVADVDFDLGITRIAAGLQVTRPGNLQFFGFVTAGAFVKSFTDFDSETDAGVSFGGGLHTFFGSTKSWGFGTEIRLNLAMQSDDADTLKTLTSHFQVVRRF